MRALGPEISFGAAAFIRQRKSGSPWRLGRLDCKKRGGPSSLKKSLSSVRESILQGLDHHKVSAQNEASHFLQLSSPQSPLVVGVHPGTRWPKVGAATGQCGIVADGAGGGQKDPGQRQ
jgi:hypothetical protein